MQIKIGTRGSLLALAQVRLLVNAIERFHPDVKLEIIEIKTSGDKKQGTAAAAKGDKKDWILEIEQAVLEGTVDIAVHSGKDVPSDIEPGTEIHSVLEREHALDVFIGQQDDSGRRLRWKDLPPGARIGTASLRRQASLLSLRPDLKLVEHRGNVPTRLQKLAENKLLSGIVLARAGIERLGLTEVTFDEFSPFQVMPAVNQGIVCAQIRSGATDMLKIIRSVTDQTTSVCFQAERSCIEILGADCKSSVSAYATVKDDQLLLSARILSRNGKEKVELIEQPAELSAAKTLGQQVAKQLLAMGGTQILAACRKL